MQTNKQAIGECPAADLCDMISLSGEKGPDACQAWSMLYAGDAMHGSDGNGRIKAWLGIQRHDAATAVWELERAGRAICQRYQMSDKPRVYCAPGTHKPTTDGGSSGDADTTRQQQNVLVPRGVYVMYTPYSTS